MWLLLVAAGSGYLARCWQNALKTRPALTDCTHTSSGPESPTNAAAAAAAAAALAGGPGTKEDAHGIRSAQELRRQLSSSGGKSFQAKGLGRKLLYEPCGPATFRFSRSEDGSVGSDEGKVLEDQPLLSDTEDTAACCCLAGAKRSFDVADSLTPSMTEINAWANMSDAKCAEQCRGQEPQCAGASGQERKARALPAARVPASDHQDDDTFEIPLLEDERFGARPRVSSQRHAGVATKSPPSTRVRDAGSRSGGEEVVSTKPSSSGLSISSVFLPSSIATSPAAGGSHAPVSDRHDVLEDAHPRGPGDSILNLVSGQAASILGSCKQDYGMYLSSPTTAAKREEEGGAGQPQAAASCGDSSQGTRAKDDLDHGSDGSSQQRSVMQQGGNKVLPDNLTVGCDRPQQVVESEAQASFQLLLPPGLADNSTSSIGGTIGWSTPEVIADGFGALSVDSGSQSPRPDSNSDHTGNPILSFFSGKRGKDIKDGTKDGSGYSPGASEGKRKKDSNQGEQHVENLEALATQMGSDLLDPALGCLGFDATWFEVQPDREQKLKYGVMPRRIKTPNKCGRPRNSNRKGRWLRGSPKVVSSLESCLRAQLVRDSEEKENETFQTIRALNFPVISPEEETVAAEAGELEQEVEESTPAENTQRSEPEEDDTVVVQGDKLEKAHVPEVEQETELVTHEPCADAVCSGHTETPLTMKKRKMAGGRQHPAASSQMDSGQQQHPASYLNLLWCLRQSRKLKQMHSAAKLCAVIYLCFLLRTVLDSCVYLLRCCLVWHSLVQILWFCHWTVCFSVSE